MQRPILVGFLFLWLVAAGALADNEISVWYHTGTFQVAQDTHMVLLTSPGTFKVQATDGGQLGHIQAITIGEGVTGTVNLYVLRNPADANDPNYDPNDPWGAQDVGMIGFTSETPPVGLAINLAEVRVRGYLGPDSNDPPTRATTVTGLCKVGRSGGLGGVGVQKNAYLDDVPAGATLRTPVVVRVTRAAASALRSGTVRAAKSTVLQGDADARTSGSGEALAFTGIGSERRMC